MGHPGRAHSPRPPSPPGGQGPGDSTSSFTLYHPPPQAFWSAAFLVSRIASNLPGSLLHNTSAHALLPIWNALLYARPQLVVNPGRQVLTPPSRLDQHPPLPYGLTTPRILLPSPYHDFSFLGSHDWGQTLSLFCLPLASQSFTHSKGSTNFCVWTNDRQVENQWTPNFLLNSGWKRFYRLKFWDRM